MSFDKQDLRQSVLGLAIMFLFFLGCALFALDRDRLVFLSLGHVGARQRGRDDADFQAVNSRGYSVVNTSEGNAAGDPAEVEHSDIGKVETEPEIENTKNVCDESCQ